MVDPQLVRNQPAIRSGRRRRWLLPAAVIAALAVGMLAWCLVLRPVVAMVGIALVIAFYAAMAIVAFAIPEVRRRNVVLAWLMWTMAIVAVGSLIAVVIAEYAGAVR